MPSYKQLARGNWKVAVSLGYKDGKKQILRKQGFKTKKDAETWANEILNQKNKGYIAPVSNNILFKDFLMKWFDDYKSRTLSVNTLNRYRSSIETHILPLLGSYKLTEINNVILQDFYNKLIGEALKPSTVKKILEIVNGCLKYAKKLKLIYVLPTDIEKIKIDKPIIEYWNEKELSYFLRKINDDYLYFPVLVDSLTGLRVGELCGLKWKDVDLNKGYIYVKGQIVMDNSKRELIYTEILKTDNAYRKISIPPILINTLDTVKASRKASNDDFVVLDRDGNMCNPRNLSMNFSRVVAKYKKSIEELEEEGIAPDDYMQLKQITFHGLRHTHATILILNGDNIKSVSDRLGHKDVSTTLNTYTHVMEEMKENTSNLLQNIFTKIINN